jgi:glycosyltransferase involved in cell wall biosynthesis
LDQFEPVVLAENVLNLDQFPLSRIIFLPIHHKRLSQRLYYKLRRTLAGISTLPSYQYYVEAKKLRPALVHAHFGPAGVTALPIRRKLGIPLITSFYGYDVSTYGQRREWREMYQRLFDVGDLFLVEGPYMRERLTDLGCPPEKVQIQRIAINLPLFPFQPRKLNGHSDLIKILQVGRMVEKKGFEYALRAFAEVHRADSNTELWLIGDGPLRASLQNLAQELDASDAVRFLGFKTRQEYADIARQCHILLQPSVTSNDGDSEGGAPTVLLEMQASGMPIIATRHADIPNVVIEGESAILVPERDAVALAEAIKELLAAPARWETMGRAGRSFVTARHDIKTEVKHLEAKYQEILKS